VAITASFGIGAAEGWAKDGVLNSVKAGESNYCHMHFPAIDERSLSSDRPVLKEPSSEISSTFMDDATTIFTEKRQSRHRAMICSGDGLGNTAIEDRIRLTGKGTELCQKDGHRSVATRSGASPREEKMNSRKVLDEFFVFGNFSFVAVREFYD